ncbi:MAG TPA: tripartite tricarboxylate transporter substrate-binding protein [Burkholderiales bacterium]|nr:tripartite tricarboxylate transporter substrate-binding protein [Burkholderiales bacterium]
MLPIRTVVCALIAAAASVLSQSAPAQAYPARPIRIIVPFPAGGTTDIIARLVAQRMTETMGQAAVVENRGGAGGSIGADAVAKAAPDGYTILMHNITFPLASVALAQANRAPYNIDTDFAGISIAANVPLVITAPPSVPAKDLREFVTLLQKDRSLKYNYGSTGPGSYMNIVGEVLKRDEKIEMAHIPLKGAAPLKQELLAGRLQLGGDQLSSSLADIRKGSLRALATNASQRVAALPEVPTVRELGFPKLEAEGWNGLFAPAKTPREVIERLQRETVAAVRHPDSVKRLTDLAAEPVGSTPSEQDAMLKKQVAQFRPIIQELGVTID